MRVLYLALEKEIVNDKTTGYNVHMKEIIDEFERRGVSVHVHVRKKFKTESNSTKAQNRTSQSASFHRTRNIQDSIKNTFKDLITLFTDIFIELPRLVVVLRRYRIDAIYERTSYMSLAGVLSSYFFRNIDYLIEINAPYSIYVKDFGKKSFLTAISARIERIQQWKCTRVFIISRVLADYYIQQFSLSRSKYVVHHMAVQGVNMHIHRKFTKQESFKLCFLGSVFRWSGMVNLLRAVSKLKNMGVAIELYIIGGGSYLDGLRRDFQELFGDNIHVLGWVNDDSIDALLSSYHLGVIPNSNWFGSSTKLFRFGSVGLPIVAPENEVFTSDLEFEKYGLMTSGKTEDLIDIITRAMKDYDKLLYRAQRFGEHIEERHLWKHRVQDILGILEC